MGSQQEYYHSVRLDADLCMGCTHCMRQCPTEAIRVRDGKANIISERCIDCGECIRTCVHHAKIAVSDSLSQLKNYKYTVALPAPTLYGQFKKAGSIEEILDSLLGLGFNDVYEVAYAADIVSAYMAEKMKDSKRRPLISSACPAIVRLIQVRFPDLIEHIAMIQPPVEVAASLARAKAVSKTGYKPEEIGIFFITPCPAKVTAMHNPLGQAKSNLDGAISIMDIYGAITEEMHHQSQMEKPLQKATAYGVRWANSGGEAAAAGFRNAISVEGIHDVLRILEEIENNKLSDVDFFEGLACQGGCVGGPLTFENPYIARSRIQKLAAAGAKHGPMDFETANDALDGYDLLLNQEIPERSIMKLDDNMREAIRKMDEIERIAADLPGIDCGSCGAPTCRCLAEDVVQGKSTELDCIYKYKAQVQKLAQDMVDLSDIFK